MVFAAPYNGAYSGTGPRSELRGTNPDGSQDNWEPVGIHTLDATCFVNEAGPSNDRKVVIGQIHEKEPYSVPTIVLSYNFPERGNVTVTVKYKPDGTDADPSTPGDQTDKNRTWEDNVEVGDAIHYTLQVQKVGATVTLYATVNGVLKVVNMTTDPLFDATWGTLPNLTFYFKAGCYYPDNDLENPITGNAKVTFSSLEVTP